MAALLIAYILIEDARSSRLALSQNPHGQIAQLFLNEPLVLWMTHIPTELRAKVGVQLRRENFSL